MSGLGSMGVSRRVSRTMGHAAVGQVHRRHSGSSLAVACTGRRDLECARAYRRLPMRELRADGLCSTVLCTEE